MSPLLNESRLDGYAPVFSPLDGGGTDVENQVDVLTSLGQCRERFEFDG